MASFPIKILVLFFIVVFTTPCLGQQIGPQVLSAASGGGFNTDVQLVWSVGGALIGKYNEHPDVQLGEGPIQTEIYVVPYGISQFNSSFKVYPNPATDKLYVVGENISEGFVIQIYDLTGILVLEKEFNSLSQEGVDVSGISQGPYLLQILNQQKQRINQFKILKTN